MASWNDPQTPRPGFGASPSLDGRTAGQVSYDTGLRKHMLSIYNYMASGVLLTGIVALLFERSGLASAVFATPLGWLLVLAPLAFIFFFNERRQTSTSQTMFWAFATVMGLSLSVLLLRYTGTSVATAFFATSAAFAGLSLVGYTTKKDLSGMGSFLIMGLIGIIAAMIFNLGWAYFTGAPIPGLQLAISILGVLIFAGLTAYDTQRLKMQYYQLAGTQFAGKAIILGALSLYLDFIIMFQFLLSLLGSRE